MDVQTTQAPLQVHLTETPFCKRCGNQFEARHNAQIFCERCLVCPEIDCGKALRLDNMLGYCRIHRFPGNRESTHIAVCKAKECGRTLRSDNTTGFCVDHARPRKLRRESKISAAELKSQYEANDAIGLNKLAKLAGVSAKTVRSMLVEAGCKIRRPTARLSPQELGEFNRAIARKHWDERPCVSKEELATFRANPNEERDRGIRDRVLCRICGVFAVALDPPARHLKGCHDLTPTDYRQMFPGAPLCSPKTQAQRTKGHYRHYWNHRNEMVTKARSYHAQKRSKLANAEQQEQALVDAERRVIELREELRRAEANLENVKVGRTKTFEEDVTQYGPRVTDLKARKSWGQLTKIMNRETGKTNTQSYYRHIRDGYLARGAMKAS